MRLRRFYAVLGILALGGGLVLLAFATPLFGTRADFSVYNTGWNGVSALGKDLHGSGAFNPLFAAADEGDGLQVRPASLLAVPLDPERDAVLIIGPRASYTPDELAQLREFLHAGGTLVLADDFGTGNEVLEGVGAGVRIADGRALDFAFAKRPEFTIAIDLVDHELTDGVQRVVLNYPAALLPGERTRILANTTEAAWLDADGDSERDATEQGGPLAWLATEPVGNGTLILLTDPSVLINSMRSFGGNERLAQNLALHVVALGGAVHLDEAHRDINEPLTFLALRIRALPVLVRVLLVVGAAAAILLVASGTLGRGAERARGLVARLLSAPPEEPPAEDLLERVRRRHPDWDGTVLRDLLDGWEVKEPR